MSTRALLPLLGLALLGLAPLGCGASALAGAKAVKPEPQEQYQTLEDARAAFERYAAELGEPLAGDNGGLAAAPPAPDAAAPSAGAPVPSASMTPHASSSAGYADRDEARAEKSEDGRKQKDARCETPCKAFASLKRAGDAICRLDTPDGAHCKQAKQRIAAATDRLASCSC